MNITLGHLPFIAVEVDAEVTPFKVTLWGNGDEITPEIVAALANGLREAARYIETLDTSKLAEVRPAANVATAPNLAGEIRDFGDDEKDLE